MSENNNNNKDFSERMNAFKEEAKKAMKETTESILKKIELEKRKAEIKSEIGHNSRELSKSYEKLGRQYFSYKEEHTEIGGEKETFELIRSKEKLIELLNEKLDQLENE